MSDDSIEIQFDNQEVNNALLQLARKGENLRPLMKNIAGIFAYSTEENFKEQGRPDKWVDLAESTKKQRLKKRKWSGQILQVEGMLASSINTYYDNKNKSAEIPARPYIQIIDIEYNEILNTLKKYFFLNYYYIFIIFE